MSWVLANLPTIAGHLLAHLLQAVPAIIASFVLAVPVARLARASRPLRAVLVTGSSLLYAVPSLALFVILPIILATGIRTNEWFLPINADAEREYTFCVTASNRYRIESRPSRSTYYYFSRYDK